MGFPPWFRQAIQGRLNEVSGRIEHDPDASDGNKRAREAKFTVF